MVIFYYPMHFNRGNGNENNDFIKPFVSTLVNAEIPFKIIEEPDFKVKYPRNKKAIQFDFWFKVVIAIRKLIPLNLFSNFEAREQWLGKTLRYLTFNYFKAEVVFTLSNSMAGFWRGYNPKARIIDYQHGIIDQNQIGFFEKSTAPEHITYNKKEVAVWGNSFKKFFENAGGYYKNNVHVLGYFKSITDNISLLKHNRIVFSLQFLPGFGEKLNQEMYDKLEDVLRDLDALPNIHQPEVILRHHPRHENIISVKKLIERFNFVKLMDSSSILIPLDYSMHITFFSTVAFEMAMQGVPSYFLTTTNLNQGKKIFIEEYQYPGLNLTKVAEQWMMYCTDEDKWLADCKRVKEWSSKFFEPFNEKLLLEIVNGNKK